MPQHLEVVGRTIATDWTRLLRPFNYDTTRFWWMPGTILPLYGAEQYLGPLASYLLFSTLFLVVAFALAVLVTRSLCFAATLTFMFAFGTQLNYAYTYGYLIGLYLMLIYAAINFVIGVLLVSRRLAGWGWHAAFVVSLGILALSTEWWINYATALLAAVTFGLAWSRRHRNANVFAPLSFISIATITVLGFYLLIRGQFPAQLIQPGEEEELLITYQYPILMVEDVITNFFTLLYMAIDNYLPSFVSSSNSLTYLDPSTITTQQHGYDSTHQHLVVMSHLFLWRFYAGVAVTLFLAFVVGVAIRAWQTPSHAPALVTAFALMVLAGFTTHLLIKMRPYNVVPALSYKVVVSTSAWTVLVAYLTMLSASFVRSVRTHYAIVATVWLCVLVAALTRPGMQARLLAEVGLIGLRDPLGQMLHWLK